MSLKQADTGRDERLKRVQVILTPSTVALSKPLHISKLEFSNRSERCKKNCTLSFGLGLDRGTRQKGSIFQGIVAALAKFLSAFPIFFKTSLHPET